MAMGDIGAVPAYIGVMSRGGKRLVWRIAGSVVAGMVLTVGVAWGLWLSTEEPMGNFEVTRTDWPIAVPADWPGPPEHYTNTTATRRLDRWIAHRVGANGKWEVMTNVDRFRIGWPARAMLLRERGELHFASVTVRSDHNGIRIPDWVPSWMMPGMMRPKGVPWHPLWPGFALNAPSYGAIVFLIWSAPGFVRRRSRRRRGLCVVCEYDLRGSTPGAECPECGT